MIPGSIAGVNTQFPRFSATDDFTDAKQSKISNGTVQLLTVLQRNSDTMTVVQGTDLHRRSAQEICNLAASMSRDFPSYPPSGAGVIIIFHTEAGLFFLGAVRENPCLKNLKINDQHFYPLQINASIGGYLADPDSPFAEGVVSAVKAKILSRDLAVDNLQVQKSNQLLQGMCNAIESDEGWETNICIHTDKWGDAGKEQTMSHLTGVKHLSATEADRIAIEEALKTVLSSSTGPESKVVTNFSFAVLEPMIQNSAEFWDKDEITKAQSAWEKYGNEITVTFNDLAVVALKKSNAFESTSSVRLDLHKI